MIARLGAPAVATRSNQLAAVLLVAMAVLFVSVRVLEDPANPATFFRVLVSGLAIACVYLARRQSLLRRATIFIALEAIGGLVAFTYIDVPFVVNHQEQIGRFALAVYTLIHSL
jgi:hypothetical protein